MTAESSGTVKTHGNAGTVTPPLSNGRTGSARQQDSFQVLEFLLGKEHFAIDLFDVREVVEYTTITKLPNTLPYMKGIIDLRGEITTILDLKERLHILRVNDRSDESGRIIVLDEKLTGAKTGILVDDVLAVSTFEKGDVDAASTAGAGDDAAILGIIKKRAKDKENTVHELVIWIDIRETLRHIDKRV
ncbi:MAG: chemotaxis protein CheW [Methanoregula sp.]